MPRWPAKTDSDDVRIPTSAPFDLNVASQGGPDIVTIPTGADVEKLCDDEKFLNELIEIRCKSSGDNNAPKAVEIMVHTGGITGPMGPATPENPNGTPGIAGRGGKKVSYVFAYDQKYRVPRFVFEALANAKTTSLRQIPHPTNPMERLQTQVHTFSYNFECVNDPAGARGQAWREYVLSRAA